LLPYLNKSTALEPSLKCAQYSVVRDVGVTAFCRI